MLQANGRETCRKREEEAEAAKEQALSAGGISRAEGSDRRKVCTQLLRSQWGEILPVYSQG